MPTTPPLPKNEPGDDGGVTAEGSSKAPARDTESARAQATLRGRKRTKTGCLTCRKRRIKCGEERPICANCIRSKRTCEGYAPRLTFREPVALGGAGWATRGIGRMEGQSIQPQIHSAGAREYLAAQSSSSTSSHFPIIAPRPPLVDMSGGYLSGQDPLAWSATPPAHGQAIYYSPEAHMTGPASAPFPGPMDARGSPVPIPQRATTHPRPSMMWAHSAAPAPVEYAPHPFSADAIAMMSATYGSPDRYGSVHSAPLDPLGESHSSSKWQPPPHSAGGSSGMMASLPSSGFDMPSTYAIAEDDYYDVDSDDSVPMPAGTVASQPRYEHGLMLAMKSSRDDPTIRSQDAFLENPDILATYVPNFSASPLMDNTTARIFCHFITSTAPFLSIFERHPVNPYVIFSGRPVPRPQQALWTYVLPMMAMNNQTLLQTMLALASLQIARLQNTAPTVSMRHYHYALRRVAKAVSVPSKRASIPTLAATLLLGHYEATTAEHFKWSSHLAGARQLILETDYPGTVRKIRTMRAYEANHPNQPWQNAYVGLQFQPMRSTLPWVPEAGSADEQTLGTVMGRSVHYADFAIETASESMLTEKDLEDFQVYRDLFWFYCKQDIIQSCISGNPLLLPYDQWLHCPPRGPIGKIDAVHGTMDHVLLLTGRVCAFAYKDQARKAKAQAAQSDQSWSASADPFASDVSDSMPSYGMIPGIYPSALPHAFKDAPRGQIYDPAATELEDIDLSTLTAEAEREWKEIRSAFALFERSLGSAFQPLPQDAALEVNTPFGPAIHYRTYHVATIWSYFYTARIIHMRSHPSMPPSAAEAAELVAGKTATFTTAIARIALALQPPADGQPLNPGFGAALSESMLSLLLAGVCYTDAAQRAVTIDRLRLIADRAGVESAALVAQSLEGCWVRQAEGGRGPPYTRTVELRRTHALEEDDAHADAMGHARVTEGENQVVYIPAAESAGRGKNWLRGMMGGPPEDTGGMPFPGMY